MRLFEHCYSIFWPKENVQYHLFFIICFYNVDVYDKTSIIKYNIIAYVLLILCIENLANSITKFMTNLSLHKVNFLD